MQFTWLEKMASDGDIRPEAKARIYADCSALLKTGGLGSQFTRPTDAQALAAAKQVAQTVGVLGLYFGGKAYLKNEKLNKTVDGIRDARAGILADPAFEGHIEKADARFTELAKVAPTIAADKKKARDLVGRALHTGFSNEDMNHLAVLQAVYTAADPTYASQVDSKMQKKASAERVGEMYADVVGILKEAGIFAGMSEGIRRGLDATKQVSGGIRSSTVGQALRNVALVSSIPLLAGLGHGVVNHISAKRDSREMAKKLRTSFDEAMRRDQRADPSETRGVSLNDNPSEAYRAFETLVHFAPHVALHPDSARSFMIRAMGNAQHIELPDVKQLTEIERNLAGASQQSPFASGFTQAAGAFGLGEGLRSAIKDSTEPLRTQSKNMIARDIGVRTKDS